MSVYVGSALMQCKLSIYSMQKDTEVRLVTAALSLRAHTCIRTYIHSTATMAASQIHIASTVFLLLAVAPLLPTLGQFIHTVPCGYRNASCVCREDADVCKFQLIVELAQTFTRYVPTEPDEPQGIGRLYYINTTGELVALPGGSEDDPNACAPESDGCSDPVIADGLSYRSIFTINGQLFGPTLVVWENQTLVIDVRNNMLSESTSIHWHGMHQINTPWMDGVGHLSQCPIDPGSTFRYIFKAFPSGTFWYHSHLGVQRLDGLTGSLIIRERNIDYPISFEDLPDQHTVILSDWFAEASSEIFTQFRAQTGFYPDVPPGQLPTDPNGFYEKTNGIDGSVIGLLPYHSGLINGKGRHTDVPYNQSRLHVFEVEQGNTYRFRLIGAQTLFAYIFSISGHKLKVIATDGNFVEPREVDYIVVHTGERWDFLLVANQNSQSNYWIRATTFEVDSTSSTQAPYLSLNNTVEAILHYSGSSIPTSLEYINIPDTSGCMEPPCWGANINGGCGEQTCTAMNCPFERFHPSYEIECIHVNELQLSSPTPDYKIPSTVPDQTIFLNFDDDSAINGRANKFPPFPLQTQTEEALDSINRCDPDDLCEEECSCTHIYDIPFDKTIRLVFSAVGEDSRFFHPIHLHGHRFFVVAAGYGTYSTTTGFLDSSSRDILCNDEVDEPVDEVFCSHNIRWRNNEPTISLNETTVQKDTVIVPAGGYVIVHYISNNPGFWFLHCHVEPHLAMGMGVVLNEAQDRQNPPPEGMRTCGTFQWDVGDFVEKLEFDPSDDGAKESVRLAGSVVVVLALIALLM